MRVPQGQRPVAVVWWLYREAQAGRLAVAGVTLEALAPWGHNSLRIDVRDTARAPEPEHGLAHLTHLMEQIRTGAWRVRAVTLHPAERRIMLPRYPELAEYQVDPWGLGSVQVIYAQEMHFWRRRRRRLSPPRARRRDDAQLLRMRQLQQARVLRGLVAADIRRLATQDLPERERERILSAIQATYRTIDGLLHPRKPGVWDDDDWDQDDW